jgi:hypothetical protein
MPLNRLLFTLACVIATAAATIYLAVSLTARAAIPPVTGFAVLGVIAMCASFGWRVYSDRRRAKDNPPRDD